MGTLSYILLILALSIVVYLLKTAGSMYLVFSFFLLMSSFGFLGLYINNETLQNRIVKLLIFSFYIGSIVSFTNVDEDNKYLRGLNKSIASYYLWTIGFLGIILLSIYPNNINQAKQRLEVRILLFIVSFFTAIGLLFYLTSWLMTFEKFRNGSEYAKYLGKILIISLISITFIGLLVLNGDLILMPVKDGIKKLNVSKYGPTNFIYSILIYLPCLLIDIIKFLNKEFKLAKNETRILLVLEVILIILYLLYPKIIKKIMTGGGVVLLDKPRYLDNYYELGTTKELGLKKTSWNPFKNKYKKNVRYSDDTIEAKKMAEKYSKESIRATWDVSFANIEATNHAWNNKFLSDEEIDDLSGNADELIKLATDWDISYNTLRELDQGGEYEDNDNKLLNYSISSWIYINPISPDMRTSASNRTEIFNYGDKLSLQYSGSENSLIFFGTEFNDMKTIVHKESNIPLQKWHNIIINYSGSIIDIFINGKLAASYKDLILKEDYYLISIGADNGVSGSISNVVYYPYVLKINKIKEIYNYSKNNNPP